MRADLWYRLFFVLYCIEAGIFLLWAPWTPFWERALFGLPMAEIGTVMIRPWARGAVTGFGVIHLVWGLHDLYSLFFRRPAAERPAPAARPVAAAGPRPDRSLSERPLPERTLSDG